MIYIYTIEQEEKNQRIFILKYSCINAVFWVNWVLEISLYTLFFLLACFYK